MSSPAIWLDPATGVEERLEHVWTPRGQLYTWAARPPLARSCVVVCSSVFGDFTANYHRERLLARELVSKGVGVIRFHYAGEGNSQGERRAMTFSSLREDTKAVVDHGVSLGFTEFGFLGTRMGALVAASAAVSLPSVPIALWEPVVDPLRLVADAQRAKRMSQLAQEGGGAETSDWRRDLDRNGMLDLVGYDVYPPLLHSLMDVDLLTTLGSTPRRVLIVRFRGKPGAPDPLASALLERGFSVQSEVVDLSVAWWFQDEQVSDGGDLVTMTAVWLSSALSEKR
jgi:hypothetical protein